ncbi:hypothetical protein DCC39_15670 [Pueribacillus theae]|uniref:Uncharacterized protein n=1 Tax=Pueribacillus theae TaxID=2171751 RepID=A0A2U1JSF9_9BACI|nr:hypothetical protein [Pueribacillus theae]PWA08052.1 hypothetical protein DCC39_15670 [Pueribacillus theae]
MQSSDDKLQIRLNSLKQAYEQMPAFSNVDRIVKNINGINRTKRKRKRLRILPIGAAIAVFALVGLLIVASPDLFQNGSENSEQKMEESSENHVKQDPNKLAETDKDNEKDATTVEIDRPETKTETLEIEGMPEEKTFILAKNEHIGVSTYYPDDMVAQTEQNSIKIFTNFVGEKRDDAYFEIYEASENQTKDDKQLLSDFNGYSITEVAEDEFMIPYSQKEYTIEKGDFTGTVSIFERNGKVYRITTHYPIEWGDGVGPRIAKIIDELEFHE